MVNTPNSLANDDEFVMLLYPVCVRRRDIQQAPLMAMPAASAPQLIAVPPELPQLPPAPAQRRDDNTQPLSDKLLEHATTKQLEYVTSLAKQNNIEDVAILEEFGVTRLADLTKAQAGEFIRRYKDGKPSVGGKYKESKPSIW